MANHDDAMPGLLLRLKNDTVDLVESEVALVKAEIFHRANTLKVSLVPLGIGVCAAVTALMTFTAGLVLWVGEALDGRYTLAAMLVALFFAVVAGVGLAIGARLIHRATEPPTSIQKKNPIHALEVRNESVQRHDHA
jgi:uncharacterized membrane protein YqjE